MSAISRAGTWIDDGINPIVIKELRQVVRSRALTITLMLFLLVQVLAIGSFMLASEDIQESFEAGQTAFMILQVTLLGSCLLFAPTYVGLRMAAERTDTNVDLVFITTIRPAAIVWGKFFSGVVVVAMIFSACAPFMVLTYLLRGIDLLSILIVLGLDVLVILLTMQVTLLLGALPISRAFKAVLGLVVAVGVLMVFSWTMAIVGNMAFSGFGARMGTSDFWMAAASIVVMAGVFGGLVFCVTVAALSPPASNRALPVRVFLAVALVVSGAVMVTLMAVTEEENVVEVWFALVFPILAGVVLFASGERDAYGSRIRRSVPRRRLARLAAYPFFSGAGAGMVWSLLMVMLVLAAGVVIFNVWGSSLPLADVPRLFGAGAALVGYAAAYALTASLIRRGLIRDRAPVMVTPVLAIALAGVMTVLPPLAVFLQDPGGWHRMDSAAVVITNPFAGYMFMDDEAELARVLGFAILWLVLMLVLNGPWLLRQWRAFTPITPDSPAAPDAGDDAAPQPETLAQADAVAVPAPAAPAKEAPGES